LINLLVQIGFGHSAQILLDHEKEYHSVPWYRTLSAPAFVAGNDAPLVGDRAATRGRGATEGAMGAPV
jgi:hypothetical protein